MREMDRWNAAEDRERLDRYQQESRREKRAAWEDDRIESILGELRHDEEDNVWAGPLEMFKLKIRLDVAYWLLDEQHELHIARLQSGETKDRELVWTAYAIERAAAEANDKDF